MAPIVETAQGRLRGARDGEALVFRGVPYARPPLGPLRFAAPAPPEPWAGERDAVEFGPSAPQNPLEFGLMPGLAVGAIDEDCLTLNLYTPACDGASRPVMVWIHGGAFSIGSGSQMMYDPRPLVRNGDVVVVTINYRLGAFGFLLPDDETADANAGLLDQVAALRWVRENVAAFGGDPGNVTVFGESAGGMSVGCLLGMPAAKGLFRRAIAMSGASHSYCETENAACLAAELCADLAVDGAAGLRAVSVQDLLAAQSRCELRHRNDRYRVGFRPCLDGPGGSLPAPPISAIRDGLSGAVDLLVGCTRDEWRMFGLLDPTTRQIDEAELRERAEDAAPGQAERIVAAYREARPGDSPRDLFFAIATDRYFRVPAIRLADAQADHPAATFAYLFTWESPMLGGSLGACHGIDVPFAFDLIGAPGADKFAGTGDEARALAARTHGAWLAFARDGDPNHAGLSGWERYDADRRPTMALGPTCGIAHDPLGAERRAWDGLLD